MQPTKSGAERDEQYGCPCPIPIIATVSGHHQQIAGAKRGDGLAQLDAVGLGHFPEHFPGARRRSARPPVLRRSGRRSRPWHSRISCLTYGGIFCKGKWAYLQGLRFLAKFLTFASQSTASFANPTAGTLPSQRVPCSACSQVNRSKSERVANHRNGTERHGERGHDGAEQNPQ